MKITYKNFLLEPEGRAFNLYKIIERKNKKSGVYLPFNEIIGYGMRFETCVESIIKDLLSGRDEQFTLRQYIDEYKKLKTELLDEFIV
jgi:hypothetical protein